MSESLSQSIALAERLAAGDASALAEFFDSQRDRLWRMVSFRLDRRLAGRVDADDILQEAYLEANKRLHHFAGTSMSPFVWLRQIVKQTLIDVHRRHLAQMRDAQRERSMHAKPYPQATSVSLTMHLLGHMTSPSQAVMREELTRQLEVAIDRMNPIDQEVLALRHFEELSNSEVAEVLGLSQKAASIRYVRAISRLKGVLQQIPGFFEA